MKSVVFLIFILKPLIANRIYVIFYCCCFYYMAKIIAEKKVYFYVRGFIDFMYFQLKIIPKKTRKSTFYNDIALFGYTEICHIKVNIHSRTILNDDDGFCNLFCHSPDISTLLVKNF